MRKIAILLSLLFIISTIHATCNINYKVPTKLEVESEIPPNEPFVEISVRLLAIENGYSPLANKPVHIYVNTTENGQIIEKEYVYTTNQDGYINMRLKTDKDISIYAEFEGDQAYLPSNTDTKDKKEDETIILAPGIDRNLCLPLFLMLGVLAAAAFASGRNPFAIIDISAPRMPTKMSKVNKRLFIQMGRILGAVGGVLKLAGLQFLKIEKEVPSKSRNKSKKTSKKEGKGSRGGGKNKPSGKKRYGTASVKTKESKNGVKITWNKFARALYYMGDIISLDVFRRVNRRIKNKKYAKKITGSKDLKGAVYKIKLKDGSMVEVTDEIASTLALRKSVKDKIVIPLIGIIGSIDSVDYERYRDNLNNIMTKVDYMSFLAEEFEKVKKNAIGIVDEYAEFNKSRTELLEILEGENGDKALEIRDKVMRGEILNKDDLEFLKGNAAAYLSAISYNENKFKLLHEVKQEVLRNHEVWEQFKPELNVPAVKMLAEFNKTMEELQKVNAELSILSEGELESPSPEIGTDKLLRRRDELEAQILINHMSGNIARAIEIGQRNIAYIDEKRQSIKEDIDDIKYKLKVLKQKEAEIDKNNPEKIEKIKEKRNELEAQLSKKREKYAELTILKSKTEEEINKAKRYELAIERQMKTRELNRTEGEIKKLEEQKMNTQDPNEITEIDKRLKQLKENSEQLKTQLDKMDKESEELQKKNNAPIEEDPVISEMNKEDLQRIKEENENVKLEEIVNKPERLKEMGLTEHLTQEESNRALASAGINTVAVSAEEFARYKEWEKENYPKFKPEDVPERGSKDVPYQRGAIPRGPHGERRGPTIEPEK